MKTKTLTPIETAKKLGLVECPICMFTSDIAEIPPSGPCNYCQLQSQLRKNANPEEWPGILENIKRKGENKQYDVLIGISGGEDSSILLYLAVKVWKLRPLVIHFNNRTNRPEADNNIRVLTHHLNVNFIEYFVDQGEYDKLCDAFLMAGVQDADASNDIAMARLMYVTARDNGIKYIFNGHDFVHEGSSPAAWSYMDAKYLQSVYKRWTGQNLKNYPLYTFWDQIWSGVIGIKQIRPYHYIPDVDRVSVLKTLKLMGWQDYGGKHNENKYTAFVGNYLLPLKFGIDKRRTYLSAQIREGLIDKEYARQILQEPAEFDVDDLGARKDHILKLVNYAKKGRREDYERYNFKRWRFVIWVLMKLKIVPFTFYKKYCF